MSQPDLFAPANAQVAKPQAQHRRSDVSAASFEAAKVRRDAGMASSLDHAEADSPGWADHCFTLLCEYAEGQVAPWTCEAFRAWAYERGLDKPDEERAFGPITQKAIRRGVIARVGYAPAASSNGSPKPQYQAREAA